MCVFMDLCVCMYGSMDACTCMDLGVCMYESMDVFTGIFVTGCGCIGCLGGCVFLFL